MEILYKLFVHTLLHLDLPNNRVDSCLICFLLSSSFFFLCLYLSRREHRKYCLPPGPAPWPFVGNLLTMLKHKPHFRWVLGVADGKDIARIRLGSTDVIIVNSPDLACEFLKRHDASFASRPLTMSTEYSGRGFLSVVVAPWGDQWKKMRRILASEVLSPARFQRQEILRHEEADHFVRYLYNQCKQQQQSAVVDVRLALRYYCGNVIRRLIFGRRYLGEDGRRLGVPGKEEVEHVDAGFTAVSLIFALNPSDFIPSLRCFDVGGHETIMRETIEVIDKYHDPIIDERVRRWRGGDRESCEGREVEDILDVLISLKDSDGNPLLTTEEIKAQSAELIYATMDNPSNIVEWALAHLLDKPEFMRKAVEELDRVVGKNRLVQESDFSQLVYIKACAREALRLHPVAAFNLPHVALCDTKVGGYFIPKGSWVLVSRVGLGRNPKVWHEPLRFDPERHLKAVDLTTVELTERGLRFLSFGVGRRGCMGSALGSMMTYMLLARLLQAFEWSLAPGETCIDFSEERGSLFMARPLHACATPRLPWLLKQL